MTRQGLEAIKTALAAAAPEERRQVFQLLRSEFPIHELEARWNASAELILEAISRASDLTQRGIRGVIAEASFHHAIVLPLTEGGWKDATPQGDHPFDFLLTEKGAEVRVQVKMQRLEKKIPKLWNKKQGKAAAPIFVVETQKTRSGTDNAGRKTRPYRFGEFDVLAVSMHPSTGDWGKFMYTVANWLIPRGEDKKLISVFQPVSATPNQDWTNDFLTAVSWFRQSQKRTIFS